RRSAASTARKTSTRRSSIARSPRFLGTYPLRPSLLGPPATHIRFVGIQRPLDVLEDAEAAKDPEEVLGAHSPIALLRPDQRAPRDVAAIGELRLGQAAELSPGANVLGERTQSPTEREG